MCNFRLQSTREGRGTFSFAHCENSFVRDKSIQLMSAPSDYTMILCHCVLSEIIIIIIITGTITGTITRIPLGYRIITLRPRSAERLCTSLCSSQQRAACNHAVISIFVRKRLQKLNLVTGMEVLGSRSIKTI